MFSKMTEISKQKGKLVVPPKLFMVQNRTILLYRTSNWDGSISFGPTPLAETKQLQSVQASFSILTFKHLYHLCGSHGIFLGPSVCHGFLQEQWRSLQSPHSRSCPFYIPTAAAHGSTLIVHRRMTSYQMFANHDMCYLTNSEIGKLSDELTVRPAPFYPGW